MKRGVLILLVFLLAFTLALTGAGLWIIKTEQGLRFVLEAVAGRYSAQEDQSLDIQLQEGSLLQGTTFSRLSWRQGDKSAVVENLKLKLDLAELMHGSLVVDEIQMDSIQVNTGTPDDNPEPVVLPEQISSPLNVRLNRLAIGELTINTLQFKSVFARAALDDQQLSLQALEAEYQQLNLVFAANMILRKPYALAAVAKAGGDFEGLQVASRLGLSGSLERLQLELLASAQNSKDRALNQGLQADAVLRPFNPVMVEKLNLSATNFDPSAWFDKAPAASLTIAGVVQPDEKFLNTQGRFTISNSKPGNVQNGRLPVTSIAARFGLKLNEQQQPESLFFNFDEVLFSDGKRPEGEAIGTFSWTAASASPDEARGSVFTQGSSRFSIQVSGLNAALFAKVRRPTAISASIEGTQRGHSLELSRVDVDDGQMQVRGQLKANLAGKQAVDVDMSFEHVNPASYVPDASRLLQGDLNGRFRFKGNLVSGGKSGRFFPDGRLDLDLDNSRLANAPLKLVVSAEGSLNRVSTLLLDMNVVGNTAKASGSYGTHADFIRFSANLDQLQKLGQIINLKLDGFASAEGLLQVVEGGVSGQADLQLRQLKLDQLIEVESAKGTFSLGSTDSAPWLGSVQVGKVRKPGAAGTLLNSLSLSLDGVRSQHSLDGHFATGLTTFSRSRPVQGGFQFTGGMVGKGQSGLQKPAWKGVLSRLKVEGLWQPARSLELQKPASLTVGAGLLELLALQLKGEDGSLLDNRLLRVVGQQVQIEGGMPRFSVPRISPLLRKPVSLEPKDLVVRVDWRYRASPGLVDGRLDLTHVSGGLQVLEDSQVDVDIRQMKAVLDFNRSGARIDVEVDADKFGRLSANLALPVAQNPDTKTWSLAGDKPMQGAIAAGFTQLNWLGPMVSEGVRTSGTGQVAMAIGGTLNKPDVQGRLFAMDMDLFQLDQGIRLEEGNIVIDFTLDRATIDTLEFTVFHRTAPRRQIEDLGPLIQGRGTLSAKGHWNLTGLNGELQVKLDKVPLLQRPDRWLVVDSTASIQQPVRDGEALRIRGDVKALGAYVEMPEKGPQTLSDDVFIRGRTEVSSAGLPVDLQMQASLGDLFFLNAAGLKTRLTGGLRLVMLEGVGGSGQRRSGRRLTANGTIQTVDGTYRAYGQDLTIDRGVVNFQGPLENPGLNIRAVRKGVAVEAGVEVTGTAQRPKVTLVSDPAVPDPEKLSWMIIGRGSNSADRDSTLLLTAAAAIFGNEDESTTRKIARSVGIDDLNFSTGSLTAADTRAVGSKVAVAPGADSSASIVGSDDPLLSQRIISLGKRLSDQVYLSFDQSVTTAASIVKLNYQYSRQLSFIARAGADNAVDMLYQLSFD